ncbi:MAG TPA: hypothetical protein VGF84_15395 [Micromonosporaceae bacterium]
MSEQLRAVHPPLRRCLTGLVAAGAGLAVTAMILAFIHDNVRDGVVYTVVAAGLSLVVIGVARSVRWVLAVTLVVCAGQIAAIIGILLELVYGVAPSKATQLRRLGFNPTVGVSINLAYSTVALGLFCWFARCWLRQRNQR